MKNKNIISILLLVLLATFQFASLNAQTQEKTGRLATLIDKTDTKSGIVVLGVKPFYKIKYVLSAPINSFYVFTPTIEYAISIDSVISIKIINKFMKAKHGENTPLYEIEYMSGTRQIKIEGSLTPSQADSSKNILQVQYGSNMSQIDMNEISTIIFKDKPKVTDMSSKSTNKNVYSMTLSDDTKVTVNDLSFHQENYSTEGYLVGGEYVQNFYEFLPITRGALKLEVPFKDISSIKFSPVPNTVSPDWYYDFDCEYVLLNKTTDKGKLTGIYEFSGFTGITEAGAFFIEIRRVKDIHSI